MQTLVYPSLIALLTEATLHFVPWNRLLGRELRPPWTYIVGLAPLAALDTAWLWTVQPGANLAIIGLWAIVGAGGLGCLAGYALDSAAAARLLARFGGSDAADRSSRD